MALHWQLFLAVEGWFVLAEMSLTSWWFLEDQVAHQSVTSSVESLGRDKGKGTQKYLHKILLKDVFGLKSTVEQK